MIVVIGAIFVDIKGYPHTTYIPDGRNPGSVEQIHGGVCRNIVEDIVHLGSKGMLVSLIDETGIGIDVRQRLLDNGVNCDHLLIRPDGMGTWLAVFDHEGDVVASISKRPDLSSLEGYINDHHKDIFTQADAIVVEMDLEKSFLETVFYYSDLYHIPVYGAVSVMSIVLERIDLIKRTHCFVCNRQEMGMLLGAGGDDRPETLKEKIHDFGLRQMIVTLGSRGAIYANDETCGFIPTHKIDVVDTTGAGDAFLSGVVVALTKGASLRKACEVGTLVAENVITSKENVCRVMDEKELGLG